MFDIYHYDLQRPTAIRIDQLDRKVTTPIMKIDSLDDSDDDEVDEDEIVKKAKKKLDKRKEKVKEDDVDKEYEKGPTFPLIIHQVGCRVEYISKFGET